MAIVCGFLIVLLLCLICFFAHKTRSKIWKYGKANIFWDKAPVLQEGPNVEEWVSPGVGGGCSRHSAVPKWPRPQPSLVPGASFCQHLAAVFAHPQLLGCADSTDSTRQRPGP